MDSLLQLDRELLLWINGFHAPALDPVIAAATSTAFWSPLYLWFIYLLFKRLDQKAWVALIAVALTVLMADQITSGILKPWVGRLRPSHEPELKDLLHLLTNNDGQAYRGGRFGFPSSHAANAFGVVVFLWLTLRRHISWVGSMFAVAVLISYTRLYAGVHYPSDVLVGAVIGSLCGLLGYLAYQKSIRLWWKATPPETASENQ